MTGWPGQPVIYEINTAVWLNELARAGGRRVTLADVAAADWDTVTPPGVDAVWLMGVWERSPAGLALADANAGLRSHTPISHTASVPAGVMASQSAPGTLARVTGCPAVRDISSSQTAVFTS